MIKNRKKSPPRIARWIISRLSHYEKEHALADAIEAEYLDIRARHGAILSWIWYWFCTMGTLFHYIKVSLLWSITMFKNYLKVALRTMQRNKLFSVINVTGLAIGLTCVVLLVLWIQDEVSYDLFHKDIDRVYLVAAHVKKSHVEYIDVSSVPAVGPLLEEVFPEIEESSRFLYGPRT